MGVIEFPKRPKVTDGPFAYALMCGRLAANVEALLEATDGVERQIAVRNARASVFAYERLNDRYRP